jgi:outer membrane protein assembly factor BamB
MFWTRFSSAPVRTAAVALVLLLVPPPLLADSDDGEPLTGFHREWVWSTVGTYPGRGGIEVADVDGDGRPDILAIGDGTEDYNYYPSRWLQFRNDGSLREVWSSLAAPEGLRLLRLAQTNVGIQVVAADSHSLTIYDGITKAHLRTIETGATDLTALEIADIDGNGSLEVVLCEPDVLRVLDYETAASLAVKYGFGCSDLALGQADDDPALEIALAGNSLGGMLLDGATLAVEWADLAGFGNHVRLVDVDHDGRDEIVAASSDGSTLRAVEPFVGSPIWQISVGGVSALEAADLDGDGDPEVLYGDDYYGELFALDETSGATLWTSTPVGYYSQVLAMAAGDINLDGETEVVWSVSGYDTLAQRLVVLSGADGHVETQTDQWSGPMVGLFAGDANADGRLELVTGCTASGSYYSSDGGFVVYFDAATHDIVYVSPTLGQGGFYNAITRILLHQLDQDSALEVCALYQANYSEQRLRCDDGQSHLEEWEIAFASSVYPISLVAAELDGDSSPELLIGTGNETVYALEGASGWLRWESPPLGDSSSLSNLRVGDVLGDSAPEVVAASNADYYYSPVVIFDAAGSLASGPWNQHATALDLAQLDGDPQLEIVVGTQSGTIAVLDPATGALQTQIASYPDPITALRVADVTRDGVLDFVVVANGFLSVWGGAEGQVVWTSPYLGYDAAASDTLWVGNFDLDGVPEIAVNTGYGFALFEVPLFELLVDGFESGDTSAWSATVP